MKTNIIHVKSIYDFLKDNSFEQIQEKILEILPQVQYEDEILEFDIVIQNVKKLKPTTSFQKMVVELNKEVSKWLKIYGIFGCINGVIRKRLKMKNKTIDKLVSLFAKAVKPLPKEIKRDEALALENLNALWNYYTERNISGKQIRETFLQCRELYGVHNTFERVRGEFYRKYGGY